MLNLESLSLSLFRAQSKARERKREVACLHAIRQTSQSARKVPVNYLSASVRERGGSRRPIATIKVVRAAYYSHVRIRRETPRFPSSPSIRRGCLGETDLFLARFFVARPLLLLPRDVYGARRTERAFLRSRGGGEREVRRSFGRYLSEKDGGILCCSNTTFGKGQEGRLLGRVSKLSGLALIDSFLEVWQRRP